MTVLLKILPESPQDNFRDCGNHFYCAVCLGTLLGVHQRTHRHVLLASRLADAWASPEHHHCLGHSRVRYNSGGEAHSGLDRESR